MKRLLLTAALVACTSPSSRDARSDAVEVRSVASATEVVRVQNDFGTVEGTLEVPEANGPVPLVIIVSGSGSQDRDGNPPASSGLHPNIYRLLAEGLRGAGIASLRYDDPGYAQSAAAIPPTLEQLTYEMEVDVVVRWIDSARADARFGPIAVAGHSQGSLSAILAAERRDVGVISLAGAGRPIGKLLREQLAPPKLTEESFAKLEEALVKLEHGELAGPLPSPLNQILPVKLQPYWVTWMKYDPQLEIHELSRGALILQGRTDLQVTETDAELLAAGNQSSDLRVYDDMCHMLRTAPSKDPATQSQQYASPDLPLYPALVPAIAEFVHQLGR
jgi:pimeloyl-ACP methyl ester carboxylesterase